MTNLTPKQLDALVHELTSDADGMRSLAWVRAHVLAGHTREDALQAVEMGGAR